jgi:hypothetical protein
MLSAVFAVDVVGGLGPLDERILLLLHDGADLLAHGAAQNVGIAKGVAGNNPGCLHHLFLVDEDPVGLLDQFLEERVGDLDFFRITFPLDEMRDELHGARPVKGDEGDDFLEAGESDLPAKGLHAAGFELEDAGRLTGVEQGVGFGIVEGNLLDIKGFLPGCGGCGPAHQR